MRKLQLDQQDLIRSPKLKIGHLDLIKVNLVPLRSRDVPYTCCPLGMYPAHAIPKMFKLGHIDLIN